MNGETFKLNLEQEQHLNITNIYGFRYVFNSINKSKKSKHNHLPDNNNRLMPKTGIPQILDKITQSKKG